MAIEDLGRHIQRSSHDRLQDSFFAVLEISREAEVTDFECAVGDEDIGWFEVSVDDILVVHILKASEDVPEEFHCFLLGELLLLLEIGSEVSLCAELGDDIHVVVGLVDVQQFDYVVVLHLLHYLYL